MSKLSGNQPGETWIVGGIVLTQDSKRRALRADLRLVDGKIAEISAKTPSKKSRRARFIDARGQVILPGFVQTHVHLCQTLFKNQADDLELLDWLSQRIWPMEGAHTAETLHASARMGIHELLSSGTTCILDMGTVRHTEALIDAVRSSGIRASVGKCLMDHPKHTPKCLRDVSTEAALDEAIALFRRWNGADGDRLRISYAPRFVISCTEKLLTEVALLSREQHALVHTHASENRKEVEFVRKLAGCENIEYLHRLGLASPQTVLAHCIWLSDREIEILRRTKTNVAHCPSSNLKLASGIARVPELRKKGINVSLGADGAPCNNNLNMFQEMRLAALLQKPIHGPKSMRAQEVLDMATRDGARALGWFDDIGSIEEGKKADLVCLDLSAVENFTPVSALGKKLDSDALASSVVYGSQPSHVRWTMVDGEVLYSNGAVQNIPISKLLDDVRRAQLSIAKSVGFNR